MNAQTRVRFQILVFNIFQKCYDFSFFFIAIKAIIWKCFEQNYERVI